MSNNFNLNQLHRLYEIRNVLKNDLRKCYDPHTQTTIEFHDGTVEVLCIVNEAIVCIVDDYYNLPSSNHYLCAPAIKKEDIN